MKKILAGLLFSAALLNAGLVNAIAMIVNEKPITLYDIDERMLSKGISKEKAVGEIIDEILFDQEIKKHGVGIDIFELNDYLEQVAAANGMELHTFKSVVKQQYGNFEIFEQETKKRLMKDKLTSKIIRGNLKIADDEDMKIYYDNNSNKYNIANKLEVIKYTSNSRKELQAVRANPMLRSKTIKQESVTYTQKSLNPQMKYLLNETNEKEFTPIVRLGNSFAMLYIKKKSDIQMISFENAKNSIFEALMDDRKNKYLKEYFDKLKITADIEIVR